MSKLSSTAGVAAALAANGTLPGDFDRASGPALPAESLLAASTVTEYPGANEVSTVYSPNCPPDLSGVSFSLDRSTKRQPSSELRPILNAWQDTDLELGLKAIQGLSPPEMADCMAELLSLDISVYSAPKTPDSETSELHLFVRYPGEQNGALLSETELQQAKDALAGFYESYGPHQKYFSPSASAIENLQIALIKLLPDKSLSLPAGYELYHGALDRPDRQFNASAVAFVEGFQELSPVTAVQIGRGERDLLNGQIEQWDKLGYRSGANITMHLSRSETSSPLLEVNLTTETGFEERHLLGPRGLSELRRQIAAERLAGVLGEKPRNQDHSFGLLMTRIATSPPRE